MGRLVFLAASSAALCVQFAAAPAKAQSPRAQLQGEMDASLRDAIVEAIGDTERPIQNRFEARRRAREAAEDAVAVLRSEGYYGYEIDADVAEGDEPRPVVELDPGPRFTFADPDIDWIGEPPDPHVRQAGLAMIGLAIGSPGRAADVIAAEGRVVSAIQKRGYADVSAAPREVIVDHADNTVRPTFRIAAGDLVLMDGIQLSTQGRTNPRWVTQLAPWEVGEVYDPEDIAELERRLLDTGVYDSVTVGLAPRENVTDEGLRPVVVSLADRAPRTIEVGASYSTTEGSGLEARWTRYNVLGRADTLSVFGRLSNVESRLGSQISLPHWREPQQTLTAGASIYHVETDAYDEDGVALFADLTRRYGQASYVTLGGTIDYTQTRERRAERPSPLGEELFTIAPLGAVLLDRTDDPLDPRRGWRVEARAEPTLIIGDETLPYLKAQTQGSVYVPFDARGRTVLATRLRIGSVLGGELPDVPASRRFYAGGGGSVRGYAYQAVGPRRADNSPRGGLSLVEGSIELRQKVRERWGVVAFVDAATVGDDQFPSGENLAIGAGLGIRYDFGFGPLRADIAVPLDKREGDAPFQIYLSIGQAF